MRSDLHLHSNFSDGVLSPELLCHECRMASIDVMAITDHDTFEGSDELLKKKPDGITVISAVELSLSDMNGLHLLCYAKANSTDEMRRKIVDLQQSRVHRAQKILELLEKNGAPLNWQELQRKYRSSVGRPHIARALVHAGHVQSMQEAFEKYIGHDKCAYVPTERLCMQEALEICARAGYISVLAHPYELNVSEQQVAALIDKWQSQGLSGVEVYHPSSAAHGFTALEHMARKCDMLITGGSDFHQEKAHGALIGSMCPSWKSMTEDTERLLQALE